MNNTKTIYIVYGVSGSGKTTIGKSLSQKLDIPFYDADDFHPQSNIDKMSTRIPLEDDDRTPWLLKLADEIKKWHQNKGAVLACSALKVKYRELLESIDPNSIKWIFLRGSYDLIANRLRNRKQHFFSSELLASQFDILENPITGITITIDNTIENIVLEILEKLRTNKQQIGLIGLGTMGRNLAKNLLSKDFTVAVYNRQVTDKEVDIAKNFVSECSDRPVLGFDDIPLFVESLSEPRIIILMVNAGKPVDMVIKQILPFLKAGDCLIDGGNSHYKKTLEREQQLKEFGVHFIGAGISGGEEGALKGPSIMAGGSKEAYIRSGKFLEAIAAKDKNDNPCCVYVGPEGSGHYIKMIHNGIEYAEMQLIAELYHLLRFFAKKNPEQIAVIFDSWRKKGKDSYLLEITADILRKKEGGGFLIDKILDKAGQKGTGGWSTISALELGMPLSTISEAVMARNLSGMKSQRVKASEVYQLKNIEILEDESMFLEDLEKAFTATSILNHHIGFELIKKTSEEYSWDLNLSEIARIWTNGCIIRSDVMERISLLMKNNNATSLLLFSEIVDEMKTNIPSLTDMVSIAIKAGYPLPVMSAAANYFLTYTSAQSSANMIQAQRDYFGAHTYQIVDKPLEKYFHTNWKD